MTKKSIEKVKAPSMPFYVKDWLSDTELRLCSASTKGIWIDLLCHMWIANEQGRIDCQVSKIIKMTGGATEAEICLFIEEAFEHEFCDFSFFDPNFDPIFQKCHSDVAEMSRLMSQECHIINRRVWRTTARRLSDNLRKKKQRKKRAMSRKCHTNVTGSVTAKKASPAFAFASARDILLRNISNSDQKSEAEKQPPSEAADADLPFEIPDIKKSKHFSTQVGEYFKSIKSSCEKILKLTPKEGRPFNPYQWVQKNVNSRGHPGAIEESLKGLILQWNDIDKPWSYVEAIMKTKNGNWNEKEALKIHEKLKNMKAPDLKKLTQGMWGGFEDA